MEKSPYKLSCELASHRNGIRALATGRDGSIVSGSKDKTAILWKLKDGKYTGDVVMKGHNDYVSCVCIINPTEKHPKGFIVTGGYDNQICIYNPGETEPVHKIDAHQNAVSCLRSSSFDENSFLSCSWDGTAKLWNLDDLENPKMTYRRHTADVWSVADLPNSSIVTGSADDSVVIHARDGNFYRQLTGHTDTVRDICVIKHTEFLTSGNDSVIKLWNAVTGDCLGTFLGHTNSVYSISALLEGSLAVSAGEDKAIRVWLNGQVDQIIALPAKSIWSVKLLPNQDIVCGTSDGVIRIFTPTAERYADDETLKKFEDSLVKSILIPESDMKNAAAVLSHSGKPDKPGKKDGETKMVEDGLYVKDFTWNQRKSKWSLNWESYLSKNENAVSSGTYSGKPVYRGVEYDHVFPVDIEDGKPVLQLPYNNGQDPWDAAQKFIVDNNLNAKFLKQIADFIMKNARSARSFQNPSFTPGPSSPSSRFYDPYTGGSQYIPGSASSSSSAAESPQASTSRSSLTSVSIPLTNYLKIDNANLDHIKVKLKEFNSKDEIKNADQSISNSQLENVVKLATANFSEAIELGAINTLLQLLKWPDDLVFPVLDIARLVVLHKTVNDVICTEELINLIKRHLSIDSLKSNQMLTYRVFANMFYHQAGEKLGLQNKNEFMESIKNNCLQANKNTQVAMSTYVLNLTLATSEKNVFDDKKAILLIICELVQLFSEPEALYRILVGLGTLLSLATTSERSEMVNNMLQFENILNLFQTNSEISLEVDPVDKLSNVKQEIFNLIQLN